MAQDVVINGITYPAVEAVALSDSEGNTTYYYPDITPAYIVAEAERVAKAVQTTRTAKTLVFSAASDFHLFNGNVNHNASLISARYAGIGIRELRKRMSLDFAGYFGDFSWGAADHTAEQVMRDITTVRLTADSSIPEIWCVGNHDINYGKKRDRLLTLDEIYAHIGVNSHGIKPYENIERGYGYVDFETQKVRVVYLNTCDASDWTVTEGVAAQSEWISPTQLQWLADTALDFSSKAKPTEWGVVVVGHHPLHYGLSCFDSAMLLLEAYRNGTSGELSCTIRTDIATDGTKTYPQQKVVYDFSAEERAEIICNIHGHNHNCGYSKISSSTRIGSGAVAPWLWRLCIPNICANRYNTGAEVGELYGEYDESGNAVQWTKETETAKATSFCVISIDRKNKLIHAYIFGAGRDRVISYGEIVMHSIANALTGCSNSNASASVEDGASYSATITANEGYTLDGAVITVMMGGVDITATAYSGGTITIANVTGDVSVTVAAAEIPTASYTNQLPISTDADGNIYNGKGYKENYKLGSTAGEEQSATGINMTGFIPIGVGSSTTALGEQVVRIANAKVTAVDNSRIGLFDNSKSHITIIKGTKFGDGLAVPGVNIPYEVDDSGYITSFDLTQITYNRKYVANAGETAFIRLSGAGIDGNTIITVNEEIV